ncbi:hypothetical protein ACFLWA_07595 [Chloroflexota bacterium]
MIAWPSHYECCGATTDLLTFLSVATADHAVIEQTLNLPYPGFVDTVQMMAALRSGLGCLVTRNVRDCRPGPLP